MKTVCSEYVYYSVNATRYFLILCKCLRLVDCPFWIKDKLIFTSCQQRTELFRSLHIRSLILIWRGAGCVSLDSSKTHSWNNLTIRDLVMFSVFAISSNIDWESFKGFMQLIFSIRDVNSWQLEIECNFINLFFILKYCLKHQLGVDFYHTQLWISLLKLTALFRC